MKAGPAFRRRLLLIVFVCAVLPAPMPETGATLPSSTTLTAANWPEMKKEATRLFTQADVSALEQIVKGEQTPASRPGAEVKRPFIPVDLYFQRNFVDFLTRLIERKEADKVEKFARAITRKRLLRGNARWHPYRAKGYAGPVDVDVTLVVSPEKEYIIAVGFRAVGSGTKDSKMKGPVMNYPTKVYQP